MTIRVPDTLTLNSSEKYVLSIRLHSDGLSFAGWIPADRESFFYERVFFSPVRGYLESLMSLLFQYDFFRFHYKRLYVICTDRQYTMVPEAVFTSKKREEMMRFVFSTTEEKVLYQRIKEFDAELLYSMSPEVYDFCARTLVDAHFIHAMAPQLRQWRRRSLESTTKQLYVVCHDQVMDVACFHQSSLQLINSFEVKHPEDRVYFTLAIWKSMDMSQRTDELLMSASPSITQDLQASLQKYIQKIEILDSVLAPGLPEIPQDLMSLFSCES